MRIAILSDVHGNLYALKSVLKDIKNKNVDSIVCLGDLVGYGPFPNEVIKVIQGEDILNIIGNYDSAVVWNDIKYIQDNEMNKNFALPWSVNEVTEGNNKYLKRLPDDIVMVDKGKVIKFVHGSNRAVNEYLKENSKEAEESINEFKGNILVCGHTHIPYVKIYDNKMLINAGSIGKPKNGKPVSTYCILEVEEDKQNVEFVEVEYDYEKMAKAMEERGFPKELIEPIRTGRA